MNSWGYLLSSALSNLTRRRLMNLVAVGTTALALMVVGSVLLVQQNLSDFLEDVKSDTTVSVFLEDGLDDRTLDGLRSDLAADTRVASVEFISQDQAMDRMRSMLGEDGARILDGLEQNPLPASLDLTIRPDRLGDVESLVEELSGRDGVLSVEYGQAEIRQLETLGQLLQGTLLILGIVITLVAVVIIVNAVQLAVVSRRKEIDILQLVGATRRFIATPFVINGLVYGLVGGAIALALLAGLSLYLDYQLAAVPFLGLRMDFLTLERSLGLLVAGTLLGGMASVVAVYRTLRNL